MAIRVTDPLSGWKLVALLTGCVLSIVTLLALENYVGRDIPLGGLYLLPLIVASGYIPRWATFLTAIATDPRYLLEGYEAFGRRAGSPSPGRQQPGRSADRRFAKPDRPGQ